MKIVVTGTRGYPNVIGGVETHCEEVFSRLASRGYDITVFRRKGYCHDGLKRYKGVKFYNLSHPKSKTLEAFVHTFKAVLIAKFKLHADVVHLHAIGPSLMCPLARLLGMKVIVTHHGPDYDRDKWGIIAKTVLRIGEWSATRFANEMVVISNVIYYHIAKTFKRNDMHLIYNGVPHAQKMTETAYLEQLGIEPYKYVFAMGRFVPEKQFHLLIDAWKQTPHEGFRLVIAGDCNIPDSYSKKLKQMAAENDVILTGFIKGDPLYTLLSFAHTFVLPSTHEGHPIALLEAMSYGLPVIVSSIPANEEIRLKASCYFPVGSTPALVERLTEYLKKRPGYRIRYDMSAYNWDNITRQLEKVYKNFKG